MSKLTLAVVFVAVGAMFVGIALPLITRRIPPNRLYGLRTRATLNDEWVWYEANARSARGLLLLGVALAGLALVLAFGIELSATAYALVWTGLLSWSERWGFPRTASCWRSACTE